MELAGLLSHPIGDRNMNYKQSAEDLQKINSYEFTYLTKAEVKTLMLRGSTFESIMQVENNRAKQSVQQAKAEALQQQKDKKSVGNTYSQETIQKIYDSGKFSEEAAQRLNQYADNQERDRRVNNRVRSAKEIQANIEAMRQAKAKMGADRERNIVQ